WTTANSLCSLTEGSLVSLHTPEVKNFILQLLNSTTPVWVGRYQEAQNGSWIWCDESSSCDWTNQKEAESRGGGACTEIISKSGELRSAPCEELRFYVCSRSARLDSSEPSSREPPGPGIVPGVSLFDVLWDSSSILAEEILRSSSLLRAFRSGSKTGLCQSRFSQQEALYLHRVSSTLQVLVKGLHEADEIQSLLVDTVTEYSRNNQNLGSAPAPQWLQFSLQSFHSVVLEDPVYWLVALSARVCLQDFLTQMLRSELRPQMSEVQHLKQKWRNENAMLLWLHRYKKVLEERQEKMDVYKSINIFREQMMNEQRLHESVTCEDEDDEENPDWL
ncbi:uncharacterized protein LOC106514702, partial [Austrofundulus limnaeus]|uniref:Uncharacterized protein LOC106514702 n=1 Tax=Austrofundulus limnaeus TaxID=52670 RepID=A0A2I4AVN3_AUSLI